MTNEATTARSALAALNPRRADEYSSWIAIGMACHAAGLSCEEWDTWSRNSTKWTPGACEKKWATFGRGTTTVNVGSLVHMAREDGATIKSPTPTGHALTWSSPIGPRKAITIEHIPPPTRHPSDDLIEYLRAVYEPTDIVSYVLDAAEADGRFIPASRGTYCYTAATLIQRLTKFRDKIDNAIGTINTTAGAWIRANPVDGKGVGNANVTALRYCLVESDDMPLEDQLATIRRLRLPCAAIVHSGKKSIHAIVKIDAGTDRQLYRTRVQALFDTLAASGFTVDPACKDPCRLSRLPGVQRGDSRQYLIDTATGAASWSEWERENNAASTTVGQIKALGDLQTPNPGDDPNELIKHRYLSKGGAILLVAPTGVGKSSFALHAAAAWALGQPFVGITPARPLRTLIVQAENDEGDMAEMRDGVIDAMAPDPDDERKIRTNIFTVQDNTHTGPVFAATLRDYLTQARPDLLIIDPALAFLGADASQQKDVSIFLRNLLNPILAEFQTGLILVHHGNKPPRGEQRGPGWQSGDFAYLGAGAAEWANWARGVLAIENIGSDTVFRLRLAKRGKRIGWTDQTTGTPITTTHIAHSRRPGQIAWRQAEPDEIPKQHQPNPRRKNAAPPATAYVEAAAAILRPKPMTTTAFQQAIMNISIDGHTPGEKKALTIIGLLTSPQESTDQPLAFKPKRGKGSHQFIALNTTDLGKNNPT
jgi:regulatory protein RepA